jgi:hypothetical protein
MSGATATASGDRAVAVAGDIRDSIVVTGDRNVLVLPGGAAGTLLKQLSRAPAVTPRPRPVALTPPAYPDRIGRAAEIEALRRHPARALSLVGEALIGKTYVLSAAFDAATSVSAPDGIVFLYGRERPLRDLLQAAWEAFYDSDPPTAPSDLQLRRDLADREAVVIVDSAELTHADAQSLAATLPRSHLVVVTRDRVWWDGDAVTVRGLAEGDALALLARELGGTIAPDDEVAARTICQALGGRPVAIKQVAGLVRGGEPLQAVADRLRELGAPADAAAAAAGDAETAVARDAAVAAPPDEQQLLAALVPFGGVPVGIPVLDHLLGRPTGAQAAALAERGLLRRGSPRFALALPPGATALLDRDVTERAALGATHWASHAPAAALDAEVDPLLALLRGLTHRTPDAAVVALGRALVPALVRSRRLTAWGDVAAHLDRVADLAGDTATQAWARHELGTQAVVTGDTGRGVALLREALATRRALGDRAGARATRRNLRFVLPPSGPPPWVRGIALALVTTAVVAALVAIIGNGGDGDLGGAEASDASTEPGGVSDPTEDPDTEGTEPETEETEPETEETEPETEETEPETEETEPETDTQGTEPGPWRVTVVPDGEGTVVTIADGVLLNGPPEDPDAAWIDCPERCETEVQPGETIRLRAGAAGGWAFVGWGSAACPDDTTCTLEGDAEVTLTPRFVPRVDLEVVLEGGPEVSEVVAEVLAGAPASLVDLDPQPCEDECTYSVPTGTTLRLTASTTDPSFFEAWDTAAECDGTDGPCEVTLSEDLSVVAVFGELVPVVTTVIGEGRIVSDPAGIDCPGTCEAWFVRNSQVTLTALRSDDTSLWRWTGACAPAPLQGLTSDGPGPAPETCTLTVAGARSAGAEFLATGPS